MNRRSATKSTRSDTLAALVAVTEPPLCRMRQFLHSAFGVRGPAVALALSLILAGCATQPPTGGSALDRANANFGNTVATGAVTGALAGAALGALLGGNNRASAAMIGAAAGGALGTGAGVMVAKYNQSQAATEDTLTGQINEAQDRVNLAEAAAAQARQDADQAKAESAVLLTQYRAGKITAAQYQQQISASTKDTKALQQLLHNMNVQEATLQNQIAVAGPNSGPLRQSLSQMEASRLSLQGSLNDITAATAAVPQS
jgi:hypothetical protein